MPNKRKDQAQDQSESESKIMKLAITAKLGREFFNSPCLSLAKQLLGKILVRKLDDGTILKGYIVETEAYPGGEDKASSSFNRHTKANEPLFMEPGTTFVYMTYGMYYCLNISGQEPGGGVFLRALQPIEGQEVMKSKRLEKLKSKVKVVKDTDLCNGPSKLCISMTIDKVLINKADLCTSSGIWIEKDDKLVVDHVVACKRVGINRVEKEWAEKPWRFYIYDNDNVSIRNKEAEEMYNAIKTEKN